MKKKYQAKQAIRFGMVVWSKKASVGKRVRKQK
jgi:hypothetical protein